MNHRACHYHTGTRATYLLNRGARGEPVPLCDACKDDLAAIGPIDAENLIEKVT
jgi:hypothetical protein